MSSKRRQHRNDLFVRQAGPLARFRHPDDGEFVLCALCLRIWDRAALDRPVLEIEHAPPKQYPEGRECCLTCAECNRSAGVDYENLTAVLNARRDVAIEGARPTPLFTSSGLVLPAPLPRFQTPTRALALATVSSDERKLELKSAYLTAFATLGHSYILGSGLDQVRNMLRPLADLTDLPVCAQVDALAPGKVYVVVSEPLPCIIVMHPTKHRRLSTSAHAVFLPVPSSPHNFYERLVALDVLASGNRQVLAQKYDLPLARRLPMHWDTDDPSPLRAQEHWQAEIVDATGVSAGPAFQIRLNQPQPGWTAPTT